ncbi:methyltransferase [Pseudoclavibacter endophyticus]|uniref:Class I SAM-dependent methyltransferase n=1 Tax=Pseudoclavibacter endophyticus TaxID=1778590 RepID=A0A6H9WVX6_9MICO|nr:class I SAM-dependent methyltransferase [Pseudoclavibacter endophyticus]KAB1650310.1 class I SAM-dependent methyltransferase [Pseudoclavibacter endophyticus]GGA55237.1 methyltransferase [Pseudoclavibacter endophyticus]
MSTHAVGAAYDARADDYVELLGDVALLSPLDRATIAEWGGGIPGAVLDAGCGPGHWADELSRTRPPGVRATFPQPARAVVCVDASRRFVDAARERFPHLDVRVGDLAALPVGDASVAGVLAWYSVIHTVPDELGAVFAEFARVLAPGGSVLLGFVDGEPAAPFDHAVAAAWSWRAESLAERLAPHGLEVTRSSTRHDPGARPHGELVAVRPPLRSRAQPSRDQG